MTRLYRKRISIFLIIQEIIKQSLFFVNLIIALLEDERFGNRRSRERVIRYVMAHRRPDQVSHMRRIVEYSDTTCINNLRMNRNAFGRLCYLLEHVGGLKDSRHVSLPEKVCLFLSVLAHHKKMVIVKHDFMRSGHTISVHFNAVLIALLKLHTLILVSPKPIEADSTDSRWKWFKGCLGALDGSYINVRVGKSEKPRYRNRKGDVSINLLGVVDCLGNFIYVLPGWEGSAADARVLRNAISRPHGLRVPSGNYYLCDNGYSNCDGFLTPYRGVRYHLKDWVESGVAPQNHKEYFNMCHSKARNVIERTWGMMKMRWAVLRSHVFYPIKTQNRIIMACCVLHNFIRREMHVDPLEHLVPDFYVHQDNQDDIVEHIDTIECSSEWSNWRDNIANAMFTEWRNSTNRRGH